MSYQPDSSEICGQLRVTGGDQIKQAAARAVVSAALAESLRLGPVVVENLRDASSESWSKPKMRTSPRG